MSIVPVTIRPHLIPFFFKQSEGKEFLYGNKKVKTALFSSTVSSLGRMIRLLMEKSAMPLKVDNFNLCMTISDTKHGKQYKGEFYKCVDGRKTFLQLPSDANDDINDLMEDIFRMSFISYMEGCVENNDQAVVTKAIDRFIDKHDLLEFGFCNDTMRRLYYREKKKDKIVSRFQSAKSTQILNYAT